MFLSTLIIPYVYYFISPNFSANLEKQNDCPGLILAGGVETIRIDIDRTIQNQTVLTRHYRDGTVQSAIIDVPFQKTFGPGGLTEKAASSGYGIDASGQLIVLGVPTEGRFHTVDLDSLEVRAHSYDLEIDDVELKRYHGTVFLSKSPSSRRFVYDNAILVPLGIPKEKLIVLDLQAGDAFTIALPDGTTDFIATPVGELLATITVNDAGMLIEDIGNSGAFSPLPIHSNSTQAPEYVRFANQDAVAIFGESPTSENQLWIWEPDAGAQRVDINPAALRIGTDGWSGRLLWIETWAGIDFPPPSFARNRWLVETLQTKWSEGYRNFEVTSANSNGVMIVSADQEGGSVYFQIIETEQSLETICRDRN